MCTALITCWDQWCVCRMKSAAMAHGAAAAAIATALHADGDVFITHCRSVGRCRHCWPHIFHRRQLSPRSDDVHCSSLKVRVCNALQRLYRIRFTLKLRWFDLPWICCALLVQQVVQTNAQQIEPNIRNVMTILTSLWNVFNTHGMPAERAVCSVAVLIFI